MKKLKISTTLFAELFAYRTAPLPNLMWRHGRAGQPRPQQQPSERSIAPRAARASADSASRPPHARLAVAAIACLATHPRRRAYTPNRRRMELQLSGRRTAASGTGAAGTPRCRHRGYTVSVGGVCGGPAPGGGATSCSGEAADAEWKLQAGRRRQGAAASLAPPISII
jgi:hypothetical protein